MSEPSESLASDQSPPVDIRAKILLVDDQPANLLALRAILGNMSQELVEAHSGEEALRCLLESDFAVILMDVQMPSMDGFETAKLIRTRKNSRHTPIIFLTAYESDRFPVAQAYSLGAVDYLIKPLVPVIVTAKVMVFVDLFEKAQQVKRQAEQIRVMERQVFERKLAHENARLQESEQRFARFMQHLPGLAWIKDMDGHYVYANESAQHVFNTPQAELYGKTDADLFPTEYAEQFSKNDRQALAHEPTQPVIETLRHADGSLHHSLVSKFPIPGLDGKTALVGGIAIDISDRLRAEEELRDSEAKFRSLADSIPQLTWMTRADGYIVWYNKRWYEYTGTTPEMMEGWGWQSVHDPAELPRVLANWKAALARGEPWEDTFPMRRHDGAMRWHLSRALPVRDEQGRIVRWFGTNTDITERMQMEQALLEIETRFAAVVNHSPSCIFAKDRQGRYLLANQAMARMFKRDPEDVLGRTDADFFSPALAAKFQQDDASVLAEGQSRIFEETFEYQGATITALTVKFPLLDPDGKIYGVCGIATDITEQKLSREALAVSEERLRLALDAGRMGVWDWNILTKQIQWSETLEPIHGLAPGTFGGTFEAFQELIHPEDRDATSKAIRQAVDECSGYDVEFRNIWPDGSVHWLFGKGKVFAGAQGQAVRMIGVSMDVTQRKKIEQSTRFLADASVALAGLVDYESTLQKVAWLAVVHFADWCTVDMLTAEGTLQRLAMAHLDPGKGKLTKELHRRFPPRPEALRGIYQVVRTGQPDLMEEITDEFLIEIAYDSEHLRLLHELGLKSSMCVPLQVRGKTLGAITFVVAESGRRFDRSDLAVAEDLAHRAAVAMENARLYQEVREADRRKDEFLAMLAHELRNPLAPVRNALHIMKMPEANEKMIVRARDMAERQVHHLTRLVDDLLDVSRIMRGKVQLHRDPVELQAIVTRAVETAQPLIDSQGHVLTLSLPREALWLHADMVRMAQVLGNLLNNAAKYTEKDGRIWLGAELQGDDVIVRIRDNGIGIARDMLPQIFDLFVQAERSMERSQGGLGIGLTLVKSLVELHGGSVQALSEGPGQGSEFVVRLPALTVHQLQTDTSTGKMLAESNLPQRSILVVDDNVDAADSLALMLRLQGHNVHVAHDGATALDLAQRSQLDIGFLDIGMPVMDGYELARRLRRAPALQHIVLVAVSGWGQEEDRKRSRAAGFDLHLTKPVEPSTLHDLLLELKSSSRA